MAAKLIVIVIMITFDGGLLDGAVHPFDLSIGPWMIDLGEAVINAKFPATHIKHVYHISRCYAIGVARGIAELDTIVGEDGVYLVRHRFDKGSLGNRKRFFGLPFQPIVRRRIWKRGQ